MGENWKKTRERLENEFAQVSSTEKWDTALLEKMKNILKSMYYIDVICAMKEGEEFSGGEQLMNMGMSYARGNQGGRMGRGSMGGRGGYGYYPMDGGYGYGNRRYYDDDKKHALRRFETMMNSEDDPEMRNIMQEVLQRYESR